VWTPLEKDPTFENDPVRNPHGNAEIYLNNHYTVIKTTFEPNDPNDPQMIHLSIRANDRSAKHDWREFQLIKNELVGQEEECVELYPAESRLVDTSNQYHLWCILGFKFPFGYEERLVAETHDNPKVGQRPFAKLIKPKDLTHITLDMEKKSNDV
jgi:hypothetical protein